MSISQRYCDYATGNDYIGASFTDGAFTHSTLNLNKTNAFTLNKANHWLYLSDNGSNKIVDGYYKIATWTDASNVILATDPSTANEDVTDVVCTAADGTSTLPFRSVQGALDLIARDATNGDQVNVKSGTAQVNQAALTLATYGTPASTAPLVIRGYTTAAADGGKGEIDAGGAGFWTTNYAYFALIDLVIHNFGNNHGVNMGNSNPTLIARCEVHKGASSPSGKYLINASAANITVLGCYVHDAGTSGIGIYSNGKSPILYNYVANCPTGINGIIIIGNIIYTATNGTGISCGGPVSSVVLGNTVYTDSGGTGTGISITGTHYFNNILNNVMEGFSGTGGKGILTAADTAVVGHNATYNCATPLTWGGDNLLDLSNNGTPGASPFVSAPTNFAIATTATGVIESAYPDGAGAWYGLASTTNAGEIGAVQAGNTAPAAALVLEAGGGTYHAPDQGEVLDSAVYGAASGTSGTYHAPAASEVIDSAVFGISSGTSGTVHLPDAGEVTSNAVFGPASGTTGTYHRPETSEVVDTASFGIGSAQTGTVHLPEAAEVIDSAVFGVSSGTSGTVHLPDVGEVTSNAVFGAASALTGTYHRPETSEVVSTAVFGINSGQTGLVVVPAVGDVRFGTNVNQTTGTLDLPAVADVQSGVQYDGATKTGTFAAPAAGDVQAGVDYGAAAEYTGTFAVPAVADVKDGVFYGADGTEFEGTLVSGGGGSVGFGSAHKRLGGR